MQFAAAQPDSANLELPSTRPEVVSLMGVEYQRLTTSDGGDLYLTRFGLPFRNHLAPENWHAPSWFQAQRTRLAGTSAIYKVPTKPVRGVSLNLIVRFNRVGQEVPFHPARADLNRMEFNSPFEEFALVMQLRAASSSATHRRILTKKPLAIFVPAERLRPWQTGRVESKMASKFAQHPEVKLDPLRPYILLYAWIEAINAVQAVQACGVTGSPARFLTDLMLRAVDDLKQAGFRVLDIKPEHILFRIRPDGSLLRRRDGNPVYALVDYELLERIEERSG